MSFSDDQNPLWASLSFKLLLNTASHPFDYAKVLIQIGHEPLPPYPTKTLFQKPALGLPNVLEYVKYIKDVDGFIGCYNGLSARLLSNAINFTTYRTVTDATHKYSLKYVDYNKKKSEEVTETDRWEQFIHETLVDISGKICAVIASQPAQVVTVRIMAQFVGGENKYNGLIPSIIQIYKEDGIAGFFRGLFPRILAEVLLCVFVGTCTFLAKRHLSEKDEFKKMSAIPISIVGTTLTYPFHVVSSCMAVNTCGLIAGKPPQMPIYSSWVECWAHLGRTNQLTRGSALFFRYYHGPHIIKSHHGLLLTK